MTIPLTVVGGPHGAGKTSLVRHLMEATAGRRIVAVVRDLDALLAAGAADVRRNGSVAEWPTGCISIASDDPTATLAGLARQERLPEHVVVEAEGAANPRRLGGYGYMPGYRPDGLVTIVDATTVTAPAFDEHVDERWLAQLRLADVIIINRLDVAGHEGTTAAQRTLSQLAPSARFVWCAFGRIAPPLLLGLPLGHQADDPTVVAEWNPEYPPLRSRERRTFFGERCRSWCLLAEAGLESREFRGWVNRLPPSIVRGGGSVHLREEPQHRHEFSLIGARWQMRRGAPWGRDLPSTRITLVGMDGRRPETQQAPPRTESVGVPA